MINPISITSDHYQIDVSTKKYVFRKIGRLDRYLPRHARKSTKAEVILREVNRSHGNKYEAEVVIEVPGKVLAARDSTLNMLAAIDIVEAKLISQLHKYKSLTLQQPKKLSIVSRLKQKKLRDV